MAMIAIVTVRPLLCRNPFYGADGGIGFLIPEGAAFERPPLMAADRDSGGWTDPGVRPNLDCRPTDHASPNGERFVGWEFSNRDENLQREFKLEAHRSGAFLSVGASLGNMKRCLDSDQMARIQVAVLLPEGEFHETPRLEVREDSGEWQTALPYLRIDLLRNGESYPGFPHTRAWEWSLTNEHSVSARTARIVIPAKI